MTDVFAAPTADLGDPLQRGELPEPADRGLLDIAAVVPEKIARRAATEVDGVAGPVQAGAEMAPGRASVRLELGVEYPRPVGQVAVEVQRQVASRVTELTGLDVDSVDVTVTDLPPPARRSKPRVV